MEIREDRQKNVLIVDDDSGMREILSQVVEKVGYESMAVEGATRACQVIAQVQVDAILLDLHMPGPHGDQFLSFLKSQNVAIPPTIVVSGHLDLDSIEPLIELGVSGFIAKPFEVERLAEELGRVLEGCGVDRDVSE